jgi:YegS/Rv2252/BmrU family lipid kinase
MSSDNNRVVAGVICERDLSRIREAVCIQVEKIYDSCREKDCIENARVIFKNPSRVQWIINRAINVKLRRAEVVDVYADIEPVPFKRGFYTVDVKFFIRVTLDFFLPTDGIGTRICPVSGVIVFDKKVILFGSEGNAKIFKTQNQDPGHRSHSCHNAVIPAGTGNDFSRTLFSTSNTQDILIQTIDGKEHLIDIAKINNRYFINISSVGLDAEVANTTNRLKNTGMFRGSFAYLAGLFATLLKYNSHVLKVTIDGQTFEKESLLLAIANGKFYGGGIQPTPEANISDGLLDICFVTKMSIFKILKLLPLYIKGKHSGLKYVSFYRGKKIEVSNSREMALNIDGEITIVKQAVCEIIPKAISMVIPYA